MSRTSTLPLNIARVLVWASSKPCEAEGDWGPALTPWWRHCGELSTSPAHAFPLRHHQQQLAVKASGRRYHPEGQR